MKVVVLGTGSIGTQYAELLKNAGVEPVLVSIRKKRREELALEGYKVAATLSELDAEFCIIATETKRHVDDAIEAIKLGMKVLVEKPLGVNTQDIARLERELDKSKLTMLRVVCPLRWYDGVLKIQENLKKLGRVHTVNIWCQSYLPEWRARDYRSSYSADVIQGGVVRDLVHEIDYCNALFGLPKPTDINCIGTNGNIIEIDSSANVHLSWMGKHREIISVQLDYLTRTARRGISVFGEHGECHADLHAGTYTEVINGVTKEELLENNREVAMMNMLQSFLQQDGLGCDYLSAKQALELIDVCEQKIHLN